MCVCVGPWAGVREAKTPGVTVTARLLGGADVRVHKFFRAWFDRVAKVVKAADHERLMAEISRGGEEGGARLRTYAAVKDTVGKLEPWLRDVQHYTAVRTRTLLRCDTLALGVETGRHQGVPRADRVCTLCPSGAVEDGYHLLMDCTERHLVALRELMRRELSRLSAASGAKGGTEDISAWESLSPQQQYHSLLGARTPGFAKANSNLLSVIAMRWCHRMWSAWRRVTEANGSSPDVPSTGSANFDSDPSGGPRVNGHCASGST